MVPPHRAVVRANRHEAFKWLIIATDAEEALNKQSLSPQLREGTMDPILEFQILALSLL